MNPTNQIIARHCLDWAKQYAEHITSGHIPACQWVQKAIARDQRDRDECSLIYTLDDHLAQKPLPTRQAILDNNPRGLYFNEYQAARVLVFFHYLKHYKGEWRGQMVELEPWQCWIIATVFGWQRANHKRRFRQVYEEVARKNGKTIKLAGVGGYGLLLDNEGAPEIYAAATTKDQSIRLWRDARKMLDYSKYTNPKIKITDFKHNIACPQNDGFFIPLARDSEAIDGSNPHFALIDELHAHPTREVYDVLVSGQGARSQPLLWAITTAGAANNKAQSICLEQREYTINLLNGHYTDDEFFGIIYTLDDWENEWKDPKSWIKANPNIEYQVGVDDLDRPILRGSVKYDYLQGQVTKAINSPMARYGVLTKNFDIWLSNAVAWLNPEAWARCAANYTLESLKEAQVIYAALDLANVSDLASLTLLGIMPDGKRRVWHRSYIPEEQIIHAVQARSVPYDQWVEQGWLVATPSAVIDYDFIFNDLVGEEGLFAGYTLDKIAVDRWNSSQLVLALAKEGFNLVGFGQGFASMSPAMKELERLYLGGYLEHPNDPVLNWAMGNVVAVVDPSENVKPDKSKSKEKIDPAVALIMAVGCSMGETEEQPDSIYEQGVGI